MMAAVRTSKWSDIWIAYLILEWHTWNARGIMIYNHEIRTLQTFDLVDHEITSSIVNIITNDKTLCNEDTVSNIASITSISCLLDHINNMIITVGEMDHQIARNKVHLAHYPIQRISIWSKMDGKHSNVITFSIISDWWVGLQVEREHTLPGMTVDDPACRYSMIWAVFDPGAAHISRILWWGSIFMRRGGIILTASCLLMLPWKQI